MRPESWLGSRVASFSTRTKEGLLNRLSVVGCNTTSCGCASARLPVMKATVTSGASTAMTSAGRFLLPCWLVNGN
uniref:Uncharacterized protein n=1 Tax=Tanacetum cinerariifolium TaxID=118510 RepID=A0A699XPA0_TANCI|nr:hypothetical protein [Tanacetum cinerariifolium]